MATHSSTLARKIPWTEEPSGLQSMASQRVDTMEHICTKWPVVSYGNDLFQFPRPLKQLMSPQLWQGVLEAQDQPQAHSMNMLRM